MLGAYNLDLPIWDLERAHCTGPTSWGPTGWGPTGLIYRSWTWNRTCLSLRRDIEDPLLVPRCLRNQKLVHSGQGQFKEKSKGKLQKQLM